MPKKEIFDLYFCEYDSWFEEHEKIYRCELQAIRQILPPFSKGLEIGVGTGRFAAPLGIQVGIEPSKNMAKIAKERGIEVVEGVAEELPFDDESFDLVLMVTTICFVEDIDKSLEEAKRVLRPDGHLVLSFVDRDSPLGRFYEEHKEKSRFYQAATFYSKKEIFQLLKKHGIVLEKCNEALFGDRLDNLRCEIYDGCKKGGAFITLVGAIR